MFFAQTEILAVFCQRQKLRLVKSRAFKRAGVAVYSDSRRDKMGEM